ncbi:MAG: cob(I)yrinic acid a,c-diamide adenosyltransferase [Fimbriimonadales bacterium]|nr:cob(I)yrinic acid a,c-diamide adenosyltransferase [Fimbriimonadales bacterium]
MAKIYTRTGDTGQSGLIGGSRVSKSSPRLAAIGDVDEANAAIGVALSCGVSPDIADCLSRVQNELFDLGAMLATPKEGNYRTSQVSPSQISRLEAEIDEFTSQVPPLTHFILPGGSPTAAQLHFCRTVVRRAERSVVALAEEEEIPPEAIIYLNRLSDLLFTLARTVNRRSGVEEVKWTPEDKT